MTPPPVCISDCCCFFSEDVTPHVPPSTAGAASSPSPRFPFLVLFAVDPECLLLSVPRGAQPPWGELAGHGPSGPSFPSSLEEPGSAEGAHGEALGPRGSRVPGTCLSATGLFLPSHDRARKAVPLPLKVTILYFLAQGRNSDSINAKSDTGRGAAGGTVPSLRPHQCHGLAGRTLTSGNNGFYRHLRLKRACSRGYAGGAGRAGLAPGGLSPETAAAPRPPSRTLPRRTALSGRNPRLCVSSPQEK